MEEGAKWKLVGSEFQFCKMKKFGNWLHNNVNIFNTTELSAGDG